MNKTKCRVVKVNNGYQLLNPTGVVMTPVYYFDNDEDAIDYYRIYVSTWLDWSLSNEVIK